MNLSNKYRPMKFDSIIGQEDTTGILRRQVRTKRVGNTYLFAGPSGSGKTTTARVLAMAVNCDHLRLGNPCRRCPSCQSILRGASCDVLEFDIASYRGIDNIKHMEMTTKFMPFGRKKVYIMDEVHALMLPAWNAMLKMIEDCYSGVLFILCTTDIEKVPETARSRCQEFSFYRLKPRDMAQKLGVINQGERLQINQSSLRFIAEMSGGNMRTAEMSLMQVICLNHGKPDLRQIRKFMKRRQAAWMA